MVKCELSVITSASSVPGEQTKGKPSGIRKSSKQNLWLKYALPKNMVKKMFSGQNKIRPNLI